MLVVGSKWTFSLEAYPAEPPVNTVGYRCVVHLIERGEERVGSVWGSMWAYFLALFTYDHVSVCSISRVLSMD